MLVAEFLPIRDSVTRCVIDIDGYTAADSTFPKQSLVGDTVMLTFDYLTASPSGTSHEIRLMVYGEIAGEERLLYTGDTSIVATSGGDGRYAIVLDYVGPTSVEGAMTMVVSFGRVGTDIVTGLLANYDTVFVDGSALGNNNGTSWKDAFTDLRHALTRARNGLTILVAEGIYYPDSLDRDASFALKNGVRMYGGYPSGGGARDTALFSATVLSGASHQNDMPHYEEGPKSTFNAVVKADNVDASCCIDGFTIIGSNNFEMERGMTVTDGAPLIHNCTFAHNSLIPDFDLYVEQDVMGAGLYLINSSPEIRDCIFHHNVVDDDGAGTIQVLGGALCSSGGRPKLFDCVFYDNQCIAPHTTCSGGAVHMTEGTMENCIYLNNKSRGDIANEGAVHIGSGTITGCIFKNDTAFGWNWSRSGAVGMEKGSIEGCCFYDNLCTSMGAFGGAVSIRDGSVANCLFSGNISDGFIHEGYSGALDINNGKVVSCTFLNNSCNGNDSARGGAVRMVEGILANCTFFGNRCSTLYMQSYGGAVVIEEDARLVNCTFHSNKITSTTEYNPDLICSGGAVAFRSNPSKSGVFNCIFWGDSACNSSEIYGSPQWFWYNIIQNGYTGEGGYHTITDDPLLSPPGDNGGPVPTIAIAPDSPARNAGYVLYSEDDNVFVDARGFPRSDGKPDIGAFEIQ